MVAFDLHFDSPQWSSKICLNVPLRLLGSNLLFQALAEKSRDLHPNRSFSNQSFTVPIQWCRTHVLCPESSLDTLAGSNMDGERPTGQEWLDQWLRCRAISALSPNGINFTDLDVFCSGEFDSGYATWLVINEWGLGQACRVGSLESCSKCPFVCFLRIQANHYSLLASAMKRKMWTYI